jgi:hypothetical protein
MEPTSVADLSCGDAAIVRAAGLEDVAQLGDYTPGHQFCGPIEQTVDLIPPVDVFLLSETLEHVEDPAGLLWKIRQVASRLLLSTPLDEDTDRNPEHYWGWGFVDINDLLSKAGWNNRVYQTFTPASDSYYTFQIWRAS